MGSVLRYAAPVLMAAIATLQLVRAHTLEQSPWKGGGFGMFSTVDSPGARYVRCFLILSNGRQLEVPRPSSASTVIRQVRVVPSISGLNEVAATMAASEWVWEAYDPLARLDPRFGSADGADHPFEHAGDFGDSARSSWKTRPIDQPRVRPRIDGEPDPPPNARVRPARVRVELWRYHYDRPSSQVITTKLMESIQNVVEGRT